MNAINDPRVQREARDKDGHLVLKDNRFPRPRKWCASCPPADRWKHEALDTGKRGWPMVTDASYWSNGPSPRHTDG